MMQLLPIISYVLVVLLVYIKYKDIREAVLVSANIWGVTVVLITELLSIGNRLTVNNMLLIWSLITVLLLILASYDRCAILINIKALIEELNLVNKYVFTVVSVVALVGLIVGRCSPPNNYDSLTYHMSRVVHWAQNQSIEHYKTNIVRQLFLPPWSEYSILQFYQLGGDDSFAFIVQWASMLGSVLGMSLIAKLLGAGKFGQALAAMLTAIMPMGILQSTSTQNDFVATFWFICFVYYALKIITTDRLYISNAVFTGVALGIGLLTKSVIYLYCIPFIAWLVLGSLKGNAKKVLKVLVVVGSITLSINLTTYLRNYNTFGSPISPLWYSQKNVNEISSISDGIEALYSNVIRNLYLQLNTPYNSINELTKASVVKLHDVFLLNVNDNKNTFVSTTIDYNLNVLGEDTASNVIYVLVMIISICIVALKYKEIDPMLYKYWLVLLSSFLLFCIYIKWTPWHGRHHLSLLVLSTSITGITFERYIHKKVLVVLLSTMIIASLPFLLCNRSRPLIGSASIINTDRDKLFNLDQSYYSAIDVIIKEKCDRIALNTNKDGAEYPLWAILTQKLGKVPVVHHVGVNNETSNIKEVEGQSCISVTVKGNSIISVVRN